MEGFSRPSNVRGNCPFKTILKHLNCIQSNEKYFKPVWFFTYPHTDASAGNQVSRRHRDRFRVCLLLCWADKTTPQVRECLSPRTSQVGSSGLPKSRRSEGNRQLKAERHCGSGRRMQAFGGGGEPEVVPHPFRLWENRIKLGAESFSLLISKPQFRPTKLEQIAPEI